MPFTLNSLGGIIPQLSTPLSGFSNLMIRLETVIPPGEPGRGRSMWPGGTWVSWVQIQDHAPTASASVLRFPGGERRVVGAEDAEFASSQASSQIRPTNSLFPAAKGALAAARASRVTTPSPRSRWGSRQFSYPFSSRRFGHPGPEVNGKVQAPDKRRDPSLPPPSPRRREGRYISILYFNLSPKQSRTQICGKREKGWDQGIRYDHGETRAAAF